MALAASKIWAAAVLVLLTGCLFAGRKPEDPRREDLAAAETLTRYFQSCIAAGEYHKAYSLFAASSRRLFTFEEFYLVVSNISAARRLIAGLRMESANCEGDRGVLALVHPEFNIRLDLPVRRTVIREPREIVMWSFDFGRKEFENYLSIGRRWYDLQLRDLGGRKYAVPPWWRYRPLDDAAASFRVGDGE